ncbi:MAG: hypothetical protein ACK554_14580 [Erythrobacteraceae bacterium]
MFASPYWKLRQLAQAVVDDLNLGERNDWLGKDVDTWRAPGMSDKDWKESKPPMAVSTLTSSVVTEHTAGSWVIQIGYQSKDPAIAAEIATGYPKAFISSDTRSSDLRLPVLVLQLWRRSRIAACSRDSHRLLPAHRLSRRAAA